MFLLQKSKSKSSARTQIDIREVKDSILSLGRNRYRKVLRVSSVNFELKSDDERDAIIDTYQSFLNSVGIPLQILIRTREIDMDRYLTALDDKASREKHDIYKDQLRAYREFISSLVVTNKILTRMFYVIVPYGSSSNADFVLVKEQLSLMTDIVAKGLGRLGIRARELNDLEMLDLFYSFYSPGQAKLQPLTEQALRLVHSSYIQKETDDA